MPTPRRENWPAWRRSHHGLGYSPLTQIDTTNVGQLHDRLGAGAAGRASNMNEPLVRDGVLYVGRATATSVFAFDAASGRQLWRYQRRLPQGTAITSHKTIALYGDKALRRDVGQPHGRARRAHRAPGVGRRR